MNEVLDALTCLAFATILFPLGVWGHQQAADLVSGAIRGEERDHRVAVLRRGAITCQVVAVLLATSGCWMLATR